MNATRPSPTPVLPSTLLVSINYAPEHAGIAPYATGLAQYLAGCGASVSVLSGIPHYPSWTVPLFYSRRWTVAEPAMAGDPKVRRLRHYVPNSQSVIKRGLYEATFGARVATQRPAARPEVVIATVPSLFGAVAAARLAKRQKAPLVLWVQAIRRQYGLPYISGMPTNLYGPGDNFDLESSHVMPAMIRKMHEAKRTEKRYVDMWGTGTPRREFLHVDDAATACLFLLDNYDAPEPINIGTGDDLTIRELAQLVKEIVGYEGQLAWDSSKPDGTPRKQLDTRKINELGWKPTIGLEAGIRSTYEWFLEHAETDARL